MVNGNRIRESEDHPWIPLAKQAQPGHRLEDRDVQVENPLTTQGKEVSGYDLYSAEDTIVPAHEKATIDTQISIATPPGTYRRIAPRSGLAAKKHDHHGSRSH